MTVVPEEVEEQFTQGLLVRLSEVVEEFQVFGEIFPGFALVVA